MIFANFQVDFVKKEVDSRAGGGLDFELEEVGFAGLEVMDVVREVLDELFFVFVGLPFLHFK